MGEAGASAPVRGKLLAMARLAEDMEAWVTARTSRSGVAKWWPIRASKALRSPLSFILQLRRNGRCAMSRRTASNARQN